MSQNINANFVSLFVNHAIFRTLTLGLSTTAMFSLSRNFHGIDKGERKPSTTDVVANPVVCVLSAMALSQLQQPITDKASLERAIENIRPMFEVTEDFPSVANEAMESMEYDLDNARKAGLAALEEALAGFPISDGDFALWDEHLLTNQKIDKTPSGFIARTAPSWCSRGIEAAKTCSHRSPPF